MLGQLFSSMLEMVGLDDESIQKQIEFQIDALKKDKKHNTEKIFNQINEPMTTVEPNPFQKKEKPMSSYQSSLLPSYIYHMTHIDNLESILDYGLYAHNNPYQLVDISDNIVNRRRNKREPIYGKSIHSYVPFYFNPKNPMLYVRKHLQEDIVILACENSQILKPGSLISDGNAASSYTRFAKGNFTSLAKLNWHIINKSTDYFLDVKKKRIRMAETLVSDHVDASSIKKIICHNHYTAGRVRELTCKKVQVTKKFYF